MGSSWRRSGLCRRGPGRRRSGCFPCHDARGGHGVDMGACSIVRIRARKRSIRPKRAPTPPAIGIRMNAAGAISELSRPPAERFNATRSSLMFFVCSNAESEHLSRSVIAAEGSVSREAAITKAKTAETNKDGGSFKFDQNCTAKRSCSLIRDGHDRGPNNIGASKDVGPFYP